MYVFFCVFVYLYIYKYHHIHYCQKSWLMQSDDRNECKWPYIRPLFSNIWFMNNVATAIINLQFRTGMIYYWVCHIHVYHLVIYIIGFTYVYIIVIVTFGLFVLLKLPYKCRKKKLWFTVDISRTSSWGYSYFMVYTPTFTYYWGGPILSSYRLALGHCKLGGGA